MSQENRDGREIESPSQEVEAEPIEPERRRPILHPASGAAILALDWALFGENAFFAFAMTILNVPLGFLLGLGTVSFIQRRWGGDSAVKSVAKGIASGLIVGFPFPIAGTVIGAIVLSMSGLGNVTEKAPRKQEEKR